MVRLKGIFWLGVFFLGIVPGVFAQGIRGKVTTEKGEPLPFASIYIRNTGEGVATNQNGEYELKLKKGVYDVLAQYLGYASDLQTVVVL